MISEIIKYIISIIKKKNNNKILISIEGNIGVGKTSMINLLKNKIGDNAEYIYEPVDEWSNIKDNNGKDILNTFYDDKLRWSYTFQNIAYITRMIKIINLIKNSEKKYIILDRSLSADLHTFAKMLHDDGYICKIEWEAYNKWNTFFEDTFGNEIKHQILYLKCEPDIAYQRMKIRNRDAEKNVTYDYLKKLNMYHEKWLANSNNVLVIDANKDFVKNVNRFNEIHNQINDFINKKYDIVNFTAFIAFFATYYYYCS